MQFVCPHPHPNATDVINIRSLEEGLLALLPVPRSYSRHRLFILPLYIARVAQLTHILNEISAQGVEIDAGS